jgi:hypothetical protein
MELPATDHGLPDDVIVYVAAVTPGAGAPLPPRAIVTPPLRRVSVQALGEAFPRLHAASPAPPPA